MQSRRKRKINRGRKGIPIPMDRGRRYQSLSSNRIPKNRVNCKSSKTDPIKGPPYTIKNNCSVKDTSGQLTIYEMCNCNGECFCSGDYPSGNVDYNCNANGSCIPVQDGTGQYSSAYACNQNCSGGGGNGGTYRWYDQFDRGTAPVAGSTNKGGGGGGAGGTDGPDSNGANGGSGVVIVRYAA